MSTEPLLVGALGAPFGWHKESAITRREFLADVQRVAESLPPLTYAINLCEDRYLFSVAFAAVVLRGQTNLLPPSRAPEVVREIAGGYPGSYCLSESSLETFPSPVHSIEFNGSRPTVSSVPAIDGEHLAAIVFTSGSTGRARPNPKRWGDLMNAARLTAERLGLDRQPCAFAATVPPQHMFGLETSVMLPLTGAALIGDQRPLFPDDVRRSVERLPAPRALITTPFHLRACLEAHIPLPPLEFILSATAPLSPTLASEAEHAFHTRVLEIFGSTETGAIATRRTTEGDLWYFMEGFHANQQGETFFIHGVHLRAPVALNDFIELNADGFRLLGRHADLVNVAGKRASLGDLNQRLNAIEGVEDGVFIRASEDGEHVSRLAALVVAPRVDEATIVAALRRSIDPAFLPRPLYKVERLPRNEAGKLPLDAVLALLKNMGGASEV